MDTIKLLIADDHHIVLDGLKALLKGHADFSLVGVATNGKEAVNLVQLLSPDIILMDVDMPIMNGIEATKSIKQNQPNIKIIILTMHNESSLIKTFIAAGADGYLLKNSDHDELIETIHKVSQGKKYFSSEITNALIHDGGAQTKLIQNTLSIANLTS